MSKIYDTVYKSWLVRNREIPTEHNDTTLFTHSSLAMETLHMYCERGTYWTSPYWVQVLIVSLYNRGDITDERACILNDMITSPDTENVILGATIIKNIINEKIYREPST